MYCFCRHTLSEEDICGMPDFKHTPDLQLLIALGKRWRFSKCPGCQGSG